MRSRLTGRGSSSTGPHAQGSLALTRLDLGLADLAPDYDVLLCDVWGVVHNGVRANAASVDALTRFRQHGGTVVLITNAPAPKAQVVARLDRLQVPRSAYDDVATSGDVTIAHILEAGCPPLFNIGPSGEIALYREAERVSGRRLRLVGVEEAELAVCIGLDETGEAPDDYDATLAALATRGLDLVCANPDIVVEVGEERVWCAGAIAARYGGHGGRVVQAGKPHPAIYARAIKMAQALRGDVRTPRVLAIGDALATDMEGARNQGLDALLVTHGIHRGELHDGSGNIDAAALGRALEAAGLRPRAALRQLAWQL